MYFFRKLDFMTIFSDDALFLNNWANYFESSLYIVESGQRITTYKVPSYLTLIVRNHRLIIPALFHRDWVQ